jgi:hypothetical protein
MAVLVHSSAEIGILPILHDGQFEKTRATILSTADYVIQDDTAFPIVSYNNRLGGFVSMDVTTNRSKGSATATRLTSNPLTKPRVMFPLFPCLWLSLAK